MLPLVVKLTFAHLQETCCQASQLVDCMGRLDYPTCPNPALTQNYPRDPALFPDWRVTVESQDHRRMMEKEGKAKVVTSVWGAKFVQFIAALAVLPWSI